MDDETSSWVSATTMPSDTTATTGDGLSTTASPDITSAFAEGGPGAFAATPADFTGTTTTSGVPAGGAPATATDLTGTFGTTFSQTGGFGDLTGPTAGTGFGGFAGGGADGLTGGGSGATGLAGGGYLTGPLGQGAGLSSPGTFTGVAPAAAPPTSAGASGTAPGGAAAIAAPPGVPTADPFGGADDALARPLGQGSDIPDASRFSFPNVNAPGGLANVPATASDVMGPQIQYGEPVAPSTSFMRDLPPEFYGTPPPPSTQLASLTGGAGGPFPTGGFDMSGADAIDPLATPPTIGGMPTSGAIQPGIIPSSAVVGQPGQLTTLGQIDQLAGIDPYTTPGGLTPGNPPFSPAAVRGYEPGTGTIDQFNMLTGNPAYPPEFQGPSNPNTLGADALYAAQLWGGRPPPGGNYFPSTNPGQRQLYNDALAAQGVPVGNAPESAVPGIISFTEGDPAAGQYDPAYASYASDLASTFTGGPEGSGATLAPPADIQAANAPASVAQTVNAPGDPNAFRFADPSLFTESPTGRLAEGSRTRSLPPITGEPAPSLGADVQSAGLVPGPAVPGSPELSATPYGNVPWNVTDPNASLTSMPSPTPEEWAASMPSGPGLPYSLTPASAAAPPAVEAGAGEALDLDGLTLGNFGGRVLKGWQDFLGVPPEGSPTQSDLASQQPAPAAPVAGVPTDQTDRFATDFAGVRPNIDIAGLPQGTRMPFDTGTATPFGTASPFGGVTAAAPFGGVTAASPVLDVANANVDPESNQFFGGGGPGNQFLGGAPQPGGISVPTVSIGPDTTLSETGDPNFPNVPSTTAGVPIGPSFDNQFLGGTPRDWPAEFNEAFGASTGGAPTGGEVQVPGATRDFTFADTGAGPPLPRLRPNIDIAGPYGVPGSDAYAAAAPDQTALTARFGADFGPGLPPDMPPAPATRNFFSSSGGVTLGAEGIDSPVSIDLGTALSDVANGAARDFISPADLPAGGTLTAGYEPGAGYYPAPGDVGGVSPTGGGVALGAQAIGSPVSIDLGTAAGGAMASIAPGGGSDSAVAVTEGGGGAAAGGAAPAGVTPSAAGGAAMNPNDSASALGGGVNPAAALSGQHATGFSNNIWWPNAGAGPAGAGQTAAGTAGTAPAAAAPVAAAAAAGGGLFGGLFGDLFGNNPYPGQAELTQEAQQAQQQSQQLESYLASGTLPPGLQAGVNAAAADAQAAMVSAAASRGQTVNPQDIAAMRQRMATQSAQIATQLYQQGVSQAELSSRLYQELMNQAIQQDQALSQSIGSFASALATLAVPLLGPAAPVAAPIIAGSLF